MVTAIFPSAFVVRLRRELRARVHPGASFATPRVWSILGAGSERCDAAQLKLVVLATIHEEATTERPEVHEILRIERESARALLDGAPLTVETFDRLFEVEAVGVGGDPFDLDVVPEASVRAVLPPTDADVVFETGFGGHWSLRREWSRMLEQRTARRAWALAGLRFVVPRVFDALSDFVTPPECMVSGYGDVPTSFELHDALTRDGWVLAPRASLHIAVRRFDHRGEPELDCECTVREWQDGPRHRYRVRARSNVHVALRGDGADWTVTDATMTLSSVRSLMP